MNPLGRQSYLNCKQSYFGDQGMSPGCPGLVDPVAPAADPGWSGGQAAAGSRGAAVARSGAPASVAAVAPAVRRADDVTENWRPAGGRTNATVSLMVGDLSRKGVVQRSEDEADRRRTIVAIAGEARADVDAWLARGRAPAYGPGAAHQRTARAVRRDPAGLRGRRRVTGGLVQTRRGW